MSKRDVQRALAQASLEVGRLPRSREASLVATKIDEARMWLGEVRDEDTSADN